MAASTGTERAVWAAWLCQRACGCGGNVLGFQRWALAPSHAPVSLPASPSALRCAFGRRRRPRSSPRALQQCPQPPDAKPRSPPPGPCLQTRPAPDAPSAVATHEPRAEPLCWPHPKPHLGLLRPPDLDRRPPTPGSLLLLYRPPLCLSCPCVFSHEEALGPLAARGSCLACVAGVGSLGALNKRCTPFGSLQASMNSFGPLLLLTPDPLLALTAPSSPYVHREATRTGFLCMDLQPGSAHPYLVQRMIWACGTPCHFKYCRHPPLP